MKCKNCGILNEEDALYCKKCGYLLEENNKKNKEKKSLKNKKEKPKKKTKVKTKIKKIRPKNKRKQESKSSFKTKVFIFFLIIMIILLLGISGILGYHIYNEEKNIEVPNLENLTYQEAEVILARKHLKVSKKEELTEEENLDQIVMRQSKKEGEKVSKDTVIKVTIGKYEFSYIMEDFIGQNIDFVKNRLNHQKINYQIETRSTNKEEENNQVFSQNPKKGKKINKDTIIKIVVLKYEKIQSEEKDQNNIQDSKEDVQEEEHDS